MTIPCSWAGRAGAILALLVSAAPAARAAVEEVVVTRFGPDMAVIERPSGERWRLGLGTGCRLDQRGFQSRAVLIWSPAGALTTEARFLVPELDLSCAIAAVDSLAPAKPAAAVPEPVEGLKAMRQALELLGYDCGPHTESPWNAETGQAFLAFRQSRRLESTPQGLRRAVTSLALDVMKGRQPTGTSLRLARVISDFLDPLVAWLSRPGAAGAHCTAPTWIRQVAEDGSLVTLGDGTRWQPLAEDRALAARWQASDDVLVCSGRLVDARTGEMVRAVQV